MSKRRIQGQQGESNTSFAVQVVEVSGTTPVLLDNGDQQAWVITNGATVTLPARPYPGQEVTVGVCIAASPGAGTCTVAGGANAIIGGDFTLNDGTATKLVLSLKNTWMGVCCVHGGG